MSSNFNRNRIFDANRASSGRKRLLPNVQSDSEAFLQGGGDVETEADRRSVYVLDGDSTSERYRLATFARFRGFEYIQGWRLAEAGHFYKGDGIKTECFSCGRVIEEWGAMDNPFSPNFHKQGCGMIDKTDQRNDPYRESPRKILSELKVLALQLYDGRNTPVIENQGSGPLQTPHVQGSRDASPVGMQVQKTAEETLPEPTPDASENATGEDNYPPAEESSKSSSAAQSRKRSGSDTDDEPQSGGKRGPKI